jgi:hypothetical protein
MSDLGMMTIVLMAVPFAAFMIFRPKRPAAPKAVSPTLEDDECYRALLLATKELARVIGERNALTLKIMAVERLLENPNYNDWGPTPFHWIDPEDVRKALKAPDA